MDKEQQTHKDTDRPTHKPVDPGRSSAREHRVPGKDYEPRRSERTPSSPRKDADQK